jgi:folate-binding protein YgfZ
MESMQALHAANRAVLGEVGGLAVPLGYGDLAAEVEATRSGVGVLDLSACGVLGVRGADAALFLNGVTTNHVKALPVGRGQDNLLCATKGKILHPVLIVRSKEDEFLLVSEPGDTEGVAAHVESYHVREDLRMGVTGLARLDLLGPGAGDALTALGLAVPAPGIFTPNRRGESPVLTLNWPLGSQPRLVLLLPPAAAAELAGTLLQRGGPQASAARLIGLEAWDEARIWARVPRFGVDYGAEHLPAEAALYTHIAFDKGCYVGQEIHARMHYRGHPNRKLVSVDLPEAAAAGMASGAALYHEGQPAGTLTSLARLARDLEFRQGRAPGRRGMAMIRYPLATANAALSPQPDAAPVIVTAPVASDLGSARR